MSTRIRMLWRVTAPEQHANTSELTVQTREGLRVHVCYAELDTLAIRIGERQQGYLVLPGCMACATDRCVGTQCTGYVLRRKLQQYGWRFHPVVGGLVKRSYTRIVVAIPTRSAQPLEATLLQQWEEARLHVRWIPTAKRYPRGVAVLAVGVAGPDPRVQMRALGWNSLHWVPPALLQAWVQKPFPPRIWSLCGGSYTMDLVRFPGMTPDDPHVCGAWKEEGNTPPSSPPGVAAPSSGPLPDNDELIARLIAHLEPLLTVHPEADESVLRCFAGGVPDVEQRAAVAVDDSDVVDAAWDDRVPESTSIDAAVSHPNVLWPPGPGRMRPADVAALLENMRTSPICGGTTPGITRKRLAQLLPDTLQEYSRQLIIWFHQAGILAEPYVIDKPFREPRRLLTMDMDAMALQLKETPMLSASEARALFQEREGL